jgi:hypothetical protein
VYEAVERAKDLNERINANKREHDNRVKFQQIKDVVQDLPDVLSLYSFISVTASLFRSVLWTYLMQCPQRLYDSSRLFIREGPLEFVPPKKGLFNSRQNCYFFMFTDMLVRAPLLRTLSSTRLRRSRRSRRSH